MTKITDDKAGVESPLAIMRKPFAPNQISQLPKGTKAQNDAVKADYKKGIRCKICGQWHHPDVVHLDYVGHAALTDRLLDADPRWNWEPLALDEDGLPKFDRNNGLWVKLTVDGMTRLGYGSADGKTGGDAIKEIIGDALRNSGMRFGAALDLWHKGELHVDECEPAKAEQKQAVDDKQDATVTTPKIGWEDWCRALIVEINATKNADELDVLIDENRRRINAVKKEDMQMYSAIGNASAGRRAVFADDLPA